MSAACHKSAMGHVRDGEPACPTCYAALRVERRHVNPQAERRAALLADEALAADMARGMVRREELVAS